MILDIEYIEDKKEIKVSYVNQKGYSSIKTYDAPSHTYEESTRETKLKNWDGRSVKKKKLRGFFSKSDEFLFLHNIPDDDEIFADNLPEICSIDIETMVPNLSEMTFDDFVNNASGQVTTIAIHYKDNIIVMGLKELTEEEEINIKNKIKDTTGEDYSFKYKLYENEVSMIQTFFNKVVPRFPIITGWNVVDFDWTYLLNRCGVLNINPNLNHNYRNDFYHTTILDLADIFKRYDRSVKIKDNNKLDWVAGEVVGVKKVKYSGTLNELYHDDYNLFVLYNAIDAVLVSMINRKLQLIEMICMLSQLCKTKVKNSTHTSKISEAVLTYGFLDDGKMVIHDKKDEVDSTGFEGAYVKTLDNKGYYSDVICVDASSMYPTIMRSFNIGPETFIGKFEGEELEKYKNDSEYIYSETGAVYSSKDGNLKKTIEKLYSNRKIYKEENKELLKQLKNNKK